MKYIVLLVSLFVVSLQAADKVILGIGYSNKTFALIHESASTYSGSLTSIMCGFPLKIIEQKNLKQGWLHVQAGDAQGFIQEGFVSDQLGFCIQERYPKFFQSLNLTLTDFYYWGKIQDQYESFETKGH